MLALAAGLSACSRGDVPLAGAIAAQDAICRPELIVDGKSYDAGTAFVVDGVRPLLVRAHHLFGEMGGLPEEVRWQNMPRRATTVRCRQIKGLRGGMLWTTGAALTIAGAHPLSSTSIAEYRDIAAFPLVGARAGVPRLPLAENASAPGSRAWLVAHFRGGDPAALLHRATVIGHEQGAMLYAFDDPRIELQATSGAPVLNAGGKLVGINLGGTTAKGSPDVVGVGNGLEVVRKALAIARGG
jgi:hypothetical protein